MNSNGIFHAIIYVLVKSHLLFGEQVLILVPDSTTSEVFSRWLGPANVVEKKSPHSYIVEYNGVSRHLHADKLRKYYVSVQEISARPLQGHNEVNEAKVEHCAII